MRTLLAIAALLVAPAVAAQSNFGEVLHDEAVPLLIDAALTDFAEVRGIPIPASFPDTVWTGTYSPRSTAGLITASTGTMGGDHPATYYELYARGARPEDREAIRQLLLTAAGATDAVLGAEGAGWPREFQGSIQSLESVAGVGWEECPNQGRGRFALYAYLPDPTGGAEVKLRFGRYHEPSCTDAPVRFTTGD